MSPNLNEASEEQPLNWGLDWIGLEFHFMLLFAAICCYLFLVVASDYQLDTDSY